MVEIAFRSMLSMPRKGFNSWKKAHKMSAVGPTLGYNPYINIKKSERYSDFKMDWTNTYVFHVGVSEVLGIVNTLGDVVQDVDTCQEDIAYALKRSSSEVRIIIKHS